MPPTMEVLPRDVYNAELIAQVHPPDWRPPTPAPRYNLVVIGAGTAGLVTAAGAAGLGARVALIERHLLGGDCLNVGCVPSKALIRAARAGGRAPRAPRASACECAGTAAAPTSAPSWSGCAACAPRISHHDSAERFRGLGVDVFLGDGALHRRRTPSRWTARRSVPEGRHRHRRARRQPADPRPRRGGLPHQRDASSS